MAPDGPRPEAGWPEARENFKNLSSLKAEVGYRVFGRPESFRSTSVPRWEK